MEEINLPPGFRFHPTDEELVTFYLRNRIAHAAFTCRAIVDVDLNKNEPWDLPGKASMGEKEWYFFNVRDRKYPTGLRTNRATEAGYWKTTGRDKEIFCTTSGALVGMKKTLVFYQGRAPKGQKSNWVIHEFRLHNTNNNPSYVSNKEEWVVCRVFHKNSTPKRPQQESSPSSSQHSLDSPPYDVDTNSISNIEFGNMDDHHHHQYFPYLNDLPITYTNNNNNVHTNQLAAASSLIPSSSSSFSWPTTTTTTTTTSDLLASNVNMNYSFILKALQLRNYQEREAAAAANYSMQLSQPDQQVDHDHDQLLENLPGLEQPLDEPEQPFDMDSVWRSVD